MCRRRRTEYLATGRFGSSGILQLFDLDTKEAILLPNDTHVGQQVGVLGACSVVFHNKLILFGSKTEDYHDQIVAFEDNKLVRKGVLEEWRNVLGGCASFNDLFVMVCFFDATTVDHKRCMKVRNILIKSR